MHEPAGQSPAAAPERGSRQRSVAILWAVVLVLATFAAYGPALHGDLLWDDDQYVSENELLVIPGGLKRIWSLPPETPQYYPLVFTTFWLEARLWGLSTFGLHLVNVALHAASALVLWYALRRLGVPGAWLAGAIFALHPVHVESVAWITERKNVLSCFFYLLSFAAWPGFHRFRRGGLCAASLLLFAAALLSKTVTCSLPVAILIVHWWRREALDRRLVVMLIPYFVLGAGFGALTAWLEKVHVGAEGEEWHLSFLERGLVAGRALWFYAAKLVWPVNLVFNYPRWEIDPGAAWQYAFPMAIIIAVAALWRLRHRIGRGPLAAVTCFIITLVPAIGFFDVYPFRYSFVADHFQYHASLGPIVLASALLCAGFRLPPSANRISSALILIVLGLLTYRQTSIYGDVETLWRRTILANPDSWLARFNLAGLLMRRDELAQAAAEAEYHEVLRINPRCADAHVCLGNIAGRRGEHEQAMDHYHAALAIAPSEPTVHYNLAKELERAGDRQSAIAAYRSCIEVDATFWAAHVNLGLLLLARDQDDEAWDHFGEVLRYHPNNASALHNLGMILERQGKFSEAIGYYAKALAGDPDLASARYRLAVCRRRTGDLRQTEAALHKALELEPHHVEALADLAGLDYERGRVEEAVRSYRLVLELNPGDAQSRHNLGAALQRLSSFAEAASVLSAGLEVEPDNVALMHDLAKLLATCPDSGVRDGARAVRLAEEVVRRLDPPRPEALATLAAAYAHLGDFDRAIANVDLAINRAVELGRSDLSVDLNDQRQRYRKRVPP